MSNKNKSKKNRVTVEQVLQAYEVTNRKPTKCAWYKKGAACPLGVLALSCGAVSSHESLSRRENHAEKWAENIYGKEYVGDFISSYDCPTLYSKSRKQGAMDGRRVRKTLNKMGLI